jgi:hypothetical protein
MPVYDNTITFYFKSDLLLESINIYIKDCKMDNYETVVLTDMLILQFTSNYNFTDRLFDLSNLFVNMRIIVNKKTDNSHRCNTIIIENGKIISEISPIRCVESGDLFNFNVDKKDLFQQLVGHPYG